MGKLQYKCLVNGYVNKDQSNQRKQPTRRCCVFVNSIQLIPGLAPRCCPSATGCRRCSCWRRTRRRPSAAEGGRRKGTRTPPRTSPRLRLFLLPRWSDSWRLKARGRSGVVYIGAVARESEAPENGSFGARNVALSKRN